MSARDDAPIPTAAERAARSWPRAIFALLLGAYFGAALVGALAERLAPDRRPRYEARIRWEGAPPAEAEWPRIARPGEKVFLSDSAGCTFLTARSFTAAGTEALANDLRRRRLSGVDASGARRAAVRARWRAGVPPGPLPPPAPAAACAAQLRARLLLVALADTAGASPPSVADASRERAGLVEAEAEVVRLALAARPDSLARALTACAAAEGAWLRARAAAPGLQDRGRLARMWAEHERARAAVLDDAARRLETPLPPAARAVVGAAALEEALGLERLAPDPAAVLFAHAAWGPTPVARPLAGTWLALLLVGALTGSLAGLGLASALPRRAWRTRPRHVPHPPPRDPRRAREAELAWLHVVSGPDPGRIAHAAGALADGFLARGKRVLVVDAGRHLRLHERFGADVRWGLTECLAGEVPLLGAVQSAGRPGCFLLARGGSSRSECWDRMSPLLEDARLRFDRVILAFDPSAPSSAALPLGARVLEAWWADPGPCLGRSALALSERLGIPFACFDLESVSDVMLEDAPAAAPVPDEAIALTLTDPGREVTAAAGSAGGGDSGPDMSSPRAAGLTDAYGPACAEPLVLGCDPEVRERLRFLIWMRRVQGEGLPAPLETGAGG